VTATVSSDNLMVISKFIVLVSLRWTVAIRTYKGLLTDVNVDVAVFILFRWCWFHVASRLSWVISRSPACWRAVTTSSLSFVMLDFVSAVTSVTTTHPDGNSITGSSRSVIVINCHPSQYHGIATDNRIYHQNGITVLLACTIQILLCY